MKGEGKVNKAKQVNTMTTRINLAKPVTTYTIGEVLRDTLSFNAVITGIEVKWKNVSRDEWEKIFKNL